MRKCNNKLNLKNKFDLCTNYNTKYHWSYPLLETMYSILIIKDGFHGASLKVNKFFFCVSLCACICLAAGYPMLLVYSVYDSTCPSEINIEAVQTTGPPKTK